MGQDSPFDDDFRFRGYLQIDSLTGTHVEFAACQSRRDGQFVDLGRLGSIWRSTMCISSRSSKRLMYLRIIMSLASMYPMFQIPCRPLDTLA
jgi:hypothetical protein